MNKSSRQIVVVGGGTAGAVIAARLSSNPHLSVTLIEAGPDHSQYDDAVYTPARAPEAWGGGMSVAMTPMQSRTGAIPMIQGRLLGGTSAINAMATLRGLPVDYDDWAKAGFTGWGWNDVKDTFVAAEHDCDFPDSPIHGDRGPLPVRRWRREQHSRAQAAYLDGMLESGLPFVADMNDPNQLPGIGVFPATIDGDARRVTTSLAYLTPEVRERPNLSVITDTEVIQIALGSNRATGVMLADSTECQADEVIVAAGALWSPHLLMRSGIGPAAHLADHGIRLKADLPVGETMSDHLGPGLQYSHKGARGGTGGPAQTLLVGASNGVDIDYHAFPIAGPPSTDQTQFTLAVFLLRSSGKGSVRLGETREAGPLVTAPPMPDDTTQRLRHAFERVATWEQSNAFRELGCTPVEPLDLRAPDAVDVALDRLTMSYAHMTGTCPMGSVVDSDCCVLGIDGLRLADASVMPTIPSGNTYLGCVMVAERIARKMLDEMASGG